MWEKAVVFEVLDWQDIAMPGADIDIAAQPLAVACCPGATSQ